MMHSHRVWARWSAVVMLAVTVYGPPARGREICAAKIECITNAASDTLKLPENAVMISKEMGHCSPPFFVETIVPGKVDTVSVFIIIDHSGSMSFMDPNGSRYQMAKNLIDSIYALSPASEVGIAIFANQLLYNYQQDPFFVQLDAASGWLDSYAPLTKLNSTVGGVPAVTKLKQILAISATEKDIGQNWKLLSGYYGSVGRTPFNAALPPGYNGTTDVSLGFEAAKKAFQSASYRPAMQYIVFLSDGEAQNVDIERQSRINDFMIGAGIPTTFTAYWINQGQPVPQQIVTMTNNIRANGYSTSNPKSKVWWNARTSDEFFHEILGVIAGSGSFLVRSHPVRLTLGGQTTTSFDSTWAFFTNGFPLTGPITSFPMTYTWHYENPWNRDSTVSDTLVVQVVKGLTTYPPTVTTECWEQGFLQILHDGVQVSQIQASWTTNEVRFYPSASYPVQSATIWITNASGSDTVVVTTTNMGSYFGGTFLRNYGAPAIDNILQNGMADSVVAIYRNPALPLDVVRMAVRVLPPRDLEIRKAYYLDQAGGKANGHPDVIRVELGDTLFAEEVNLIRNYLRVNSTRGVTVSSVQPSAKGFDIILIEPTSGQPNTGLLPGESIHIDSIPNLPRGGWFPTANAAIQDSMAPVIVRASYLDIPGDDSRDTLLVVFSEPVKTIGSSEPFNFSRFQLSDYPLRMMTVSQSGATAVFAIIPVAGQLQPRQGDSIWIDPPGMISDTLNVRQANYNNVKRPISFSSMVHLVSAAYVDENADGFIDLISVKLDQPVDASLLDSLVKTLKLPAYRDFGGIKRSDLTITADGFAIRVTQGAKAARYTAVDSRDSLWVTKRSESSSGLVIGASSVAITDGMAPVIVKAVFMPGIGSATGTRPNDTLVVTFSEKMPHIDSQRPFILTASDGTQYSLTVVTQAGDDSAAQRYLVTAIDGARFPNNGDIIRIAAGQNVHDRSGMVQDDPANHGVKLEVKKFRPDFVLAASPNPGDPFLAPLPPEVMSVLQTAGNNATHGMVIVAAPTAVGGGTPDLKGKASLYDAIGNAIMLEEPGVYDAQRNRLIIVWDGANRQGRKVASGAYWAVVSITHQGTTETKTLKIGVKR